MGSLQEGMQLKGNPPICTGGSERQSTVGIVHQRLKQEKEMCIRDRNWRRLTAERNRKWEQMKQAFASEGIIGRPLWDRAPGFNPAFGQNAPRLFVLPIRPERGMVIVCAGGAFLFQSSNEAKPVAEFFHHAGLNAAVLEYR